MAQPDSPSPPRLTTPPRLTPQHRLALLMEGHLRTRNGKMGFGLLRYSAAPVACVIAPSEAGGDLAAITGIDVDVPIVATAADAAALGADVLVVAVATSGGVLPDGYRAEIMVALRAGMSLVSGLHVRFEADPEVRAALRPGAFVWDLRTEPAGLGSGRGLAADLPCRRVLTVGTDMAIGKMTASLELDRAARAQGRRSQFVASGQIGIAIAGDGVAVDAVRVDFATSAVEQACLRMGEGRDVLWIEGQGSILHPGSTAWLALMRGSMPTDLVLVHRAGQRVLDELPGVAIPPLPEVIESYERVAAASPGFPPARVAAVSLNCAGLDDDAAAAACAEVGGLTGLPCVDVVRNDPSPIVDAIVG